MSPGKTPPNKLHGARFKPFATPNKNSSPHPDSGFRRALFKSPRSPLGGSLPSTPSTQPPPSPLSAASPPPPSVADQIVGHLSEVVRLLPHLPRAEGRKLVSCRKTRLHLHQECSFLEQLGLPRGKAVTFLMHLKGLASSTIHQVLAAPAPAPTTDGLVPCQEPKKAELSKKDKEINLAESFSEETRRKLKLHAHWNYFDKEQNMTTASLIAEKDKWLDEVDKDRVVDKRVVLALLHRLNFRHKVLENRAHIWVTKNLARLRVNFLKRMQELRAENTYFGYVDESWAYAGMRPKRGWTDLDVETKPLQSLSDGLTVGPSAPKSKGERIVMIGTLTEDGMLCPEVFRTRKEEDFSDYHGEVDSVKFESYAEKALKELKKKADEKGRKAAFVMDNARYHTRYLKKKPTASTPKFRMISWLNDENITFNPRLTRKQLWTDVIAPLDDDSYNKLAIETLAESIGVIVVRQPPYHCCYNAIEFGWATIKDTAKKELKSTDKGAETARLILKLMRNFPVEMARNDLAHVAKVEEAHILDGALDLSRVLALTSVQVVDAVVAVQHAVNQAAPVAPRRSRSPSPTFSEISIEW